MTNLVPEIRASIYTKKIDFRKTAQHQAMQKLETQYKHGMKLHRKRIEQIMLQDIRGLTKFYAKMMTFIKHEMRILMVGLEADEKTTILHS